MKEKILKLTTLVEEVLANTPQARDSDQYLTLCIWNRYYPDYIKEDKGTVGNRKFVYLEDIMLLPREDNVKRIRAKIQNVQGRYLPTTWGVAKKRSILESVWRNYSNSL